jgi:hypothetical protein
MTYVCTLLHRAQELRKLPCFFIENWQGEISDREAETLLWVPFEQAFILDVDRVALSMYIRLCAGAALPQDKSGLSVPSIRQGGSTTRRTRGVVEERA